MRPQFRYNLISIKAVFTGVIMATIVFRIFNGDKAVIEVGKLSNAPVNNQTGQDGEDGGGGSLFWLTLLALPFAWLRRYQR